MLLKKIVVAEDDDAIAHMVSMALGDAGYLCLRARDGAEALKLVRVHTPDLLVLDVMMPRLDGHEVARKLKSDVLLSKTPILMLTALGDVDSKVAGFQSGADDYLSKPFDLREFNARVQALIRSARREGDRNPTTHLPGSSAIEDHIEEMLADGANAAVLHIDVSGYEQFADKVGFSRADRLVASLGEMILDRTRAAGGGSGFVGHLGGVDFIATDTTDHAESLAREIIAAFEDGRRRWTDGDGEKLTMAIAIVPTEGLGRGEDDVVATRMAAALRAAKKLQGSNYVVWRSEIV
jgi:DNA-binding response OmpR family regulator